MKRMRQHATKMMACDSTQIVKKGVKTSHLFRKFFSKVRLIFAINLILGAMNNIFQK